MTGQIFASQYNNMSDIGYFIKQIVLNVNGAIFFTLAIFETSHQTQGNPNVV